MRIALAKPYKGCAAGDVIDIDTPTGLSLLSDGLARQVADDEPDTAIPTDEEPPNTADVDTTDLPAQQGQLDAAGFAGTNDTKE